MCHDAGISYHCSSACENRSMNPAVQTSRPSAWLDAIPIVLLTQRGDMIIGGKNIGSVCIAYYLPPPLQEVVVYESYNLNAIRDLYALNRRLWYVTAYFRTGGAKPYYDWIEGHF